MSAGQAVRIVGGVVPAGLFARITAGEVTDRQSVTPWSYHLVGTETVRDAASRAWGYLRGAWDAWREAEALRPAGPGTGTARERWLLPLLRELGYGQVPALRDGVQVGMSEYPVSHAWGHVPVHLLGPRVDLDRRNPGVAGAARAPQAMVQELLNRSDDHLWAILSNGLRLRLLRDSTALAGSAYVEFDLEAIFDGELYADWLLLFQVCHVSRLEKRSGADAPPSDCWLEAWRGEAVQAGTRALEKLREGVEQALVTLGSGFLTPSANGWLVEALRTGQLTPAEYHRALLRLVYRLLFCFVAEDRGALLDPAAPPAARERFERYFSTARLRRLALVRAGGPHVDLWRAQRMVLAGLGGHGLPQIAVPALGGLFDLDRRQPRLDDAPHPDLLIGADLANTDLLTAIRHLGWTTRDHSAQAVDYRHLGAEELGGVYESLLELVPVVDVDGATFQLTHVAGNERKTTGSYYTPPALVSALLDTALDPLLDEAVAAARGNAAETERRLLALRVCDPASGSGGFMVAAARRIARRVAQARSGEDEPTPAEVQHALRDVIGRCVYGVDVLDMAAELCKVSLWLEALEPGKPLGFLDARIRVGNSLLGTTPALLADGVPEDAFKELEGDEKAYAAAVRKRNRQERAGQGAFTFSDDVAAPDDLILRRLELLDPADDVEAVRQRAEEFARYQADSDQSLQKLLADAWTAAFVWPLQKGAPEPPTTGVLESLAADPESPWLAKTVDEIDQLAYDYRFFHWHLEFPEVFTGDGETGPEGWSGGFDLMIGNPPWERVKLQEQEFFASRDPEIAKASNAAVRRRMIEQLRTADPVLHAAFLAEKRKAEGVSALLRTSGRFPLGGRGDVNTYAVFAELFRSLTAPRGQAGVIVPTGIATDATTQHFFKDLVLHGSLVALYDFENAAPIFEGVHRSFKFCLLTMAGRARRAQAASFAFFLHDPAEIATKEFALTPEEITLLNPNTGTCPVFRTRRDAEITLGIYRRVPVLIKEGDPDGNPWGISFMTMFHMSNDSHLFHTYDELVADGWELEGNVFVKRDAAVAAVPTDSLSLSRSELNERRMLPLYEAKMIHHYDIRWATYEPDGSTRHLTPDELTGDFEPMPRYWVAESEVDRKLAGRSEKEAFLVWRDICRPTDVRTVIATKVPRLAFGNKLPLALTASNPSELQAIWSSFTFDFVARQKMGGTTLNFYILMQLPMPTPAQVEASPIVFRTFVRDWIGERVDRLNARPNGHNDDDRAWLRAELDALAAHLFGLSRDEIDYVIGTFPIVRRQEEAAYGEFRSRRLILTAFDAMASARDIGLPYDSGHARMAVAQ